MNGREFNKIKHNKTELNEIEEFLMKWPVLNGTEGN